MSSRKLLNIAVVGGSGLIGRRHCQHVIENRHTALCAIVDPSSAAVSVAEDFGCVPLYDSVRQLIDSVNRPDAAIVCTPNHTHVPVSLELARAGIHVLCEKPISNDVDGGAELIRTARKHQIKLLIGHHRRFNPYMLAFKRHVRQHVGSVTVVNGIWTTVKPPEYYSGANVWRSEKGKGGVVLINLIHDIDLMHYLLGPITRIHAEACVTRRSEDNDAAEEGAAITLRFASGTVGTFIVSDNVVSPHSFEQGTGENPYLPGTGLDVYRVFGTTGTLSFPDMTLSTYPAHVAPSWESKLEMRSLPVDDIETPPLTTQLEHFVNVCEGLEEPTCSGEDGLRALVVCQAIRAALSQPEGGGTVTIAMPA